MPDPFEPHPEPTPDHLPALAEVMRRAEIEDFEVRVRPPSLGQGYWEVATKARPEIGKTRALRTVIFSGRASSLERAAVYALSEWPDPRPPEFPRPGGIGKAVFEGEAD